MAVDWEMVAWILFWVSVLCKVTVTIIRNHKKRQEGAVTLYRPHGSR
jgi:hypothetical protein